METLQFKTNIKCGGCIAKVTPSLNKATDSWTVDTNSPDKILTVSSENTTEDIIKAVAEAGFVATKL